MDAASVPVMQGLVPAQRWRFGTAVFDEASWTLVVAGERMALENKPLRLLQELIHRHDQVVSKDVLMDAIWPGVIVVEGSLTTAMNKLRRALGDRDGRIIETVPGIGYRLAVPATPCAPEAGKGNAGDTAIMPASRLLNGFPARRAIALGAIIATAIMALVALRPGAAPTRPVTRIEMFAAMRSLDLPAMRALLERGWDPNLPIGVERNSVIGVLVEICEWNPAHDKQKLALAVRMLLDAGARVTDRNVWGDTPYSIASARRYCGPDHPATHLLKAVCTGSSATIAADCLADYAHSDWPQQTAPRLTRGERSG
jgi:DNA-binding winged helix-turn-helix (wHTH) protein